MSRFRVPMVRSYLILLAVVSIAGDLRAQEGGDADASERIVYILNADSARTTRVDGLPAETLIGNVALRQGETLLNADRAVRFKQSDRIVFDGSVTIIDEGDSLAADRVIYESDVKTAVGSGNVRWSDGEVSITASRGRYFVDDKIAEFEDDVVMQDSTTTVLSLYGHYDVDSRTASFREDIYLEQRRLALTAQELVHERESGLTAASGGVWINRMPDSKEEEGRERVILMADSASSERDSGINHLNGDAGMIRIERNGDASDTLIVRSTAVSAHFTDSTETFDARGDVRFWGGTLAGKADSLRYTSLSDTVQRVSSIRMLGRPYVWSADAQVNGDTVDVRVADGEVRTLQAYENAFVGFQDSVSGLIQQLKGRRLQSFFESDSLRRLIVTPNAEALYFSTDTTSDDETKALRFTSLRITLLFHRGDIERIIAADDVEGDLKEIGEGGVVPVLQGFEWRATDRPKRDELLDDRLRRALERFAFD